MRAATLVLAALALLLPLGRDGKAAAARQPGVSFATWRDPAEGAFTVSVPQGWTVTGGTRRASQIDPRTSVDLRSPDGVLHVVLGDQSIGAFEVPDPVRLRMGLREGQTIPAGPSSPMAVTLLRYMPGAQFAQQYIRRQCQEARILNAQDLPDVSSGLAAGAAAMNAQYHPRVSARAADVAFRCGNREGVAEVGTVLASPPDGRGISMWSVTLLAVYTTTDPPPT